MLSCRARVLITKVLTVLSTVIAMVALLALCACSGNSELQDSPSISESDVNDTEEQQASQEEQTSQEEENLELEGFVIAIDAGHQAYGNSDTEPIGPGASETKAKVTSGTSGVTTGTPEHEVNLAVALLLRDELEARGATVVMIRETADVDISNSERAAIANDANADLFVRLHCDGSESSSSNGFSTLVPGLNDWTAAIVEESAVAASYVQAAAVAATGAADLGIVERTDLSGFNWCEVPTILCEMGFLTNAEEEAKLIDPDYQALLAQGIAQGISDYLLA